MRIVGTDPAISVIKVAVGAEAYVLSRIANGTVVEGTHQGCLAVNGVDGVKSALSRPVKRPVGSNCQRFNATDAEVNAGQHRASICVQRHKRSRIDDAIQRAIW